MHSTGSGGYKMAHILIVDDEEPIRRLSSKILDMSGYNCSVASDASEARNLLKDQKFELILCDINMPGESGLDFVRYALSKYPDMAAIMVTAMDDPVIGEIALDLGVYDYIIKPFERNSLLISVTNALKRRQLEIDNRAYREGLEKMVGERTDALRDSMQKLRKALEGSIQAMALTLEMRDPYTAGHQQRVADLASSIAKELGFSEDRINGLYMAGVIHDLGKISIPAEILSKPGKISKIEFDLIKTHPKVGYDILEAIEFPWPIARMVLEHHERIDGSGYPSGLSGEELLLEAKIIGVADVVEAMASHRPYRPALGIEKALDEISENKGKLYDPDVVEACLKLFGEKRFRFN
jgi:putative two-component system response regulator